jgi:hypothetical protein
MPGSTPSSAWRAAAGAGRAVIDTTLNGSYLAIPLDREADLVHSVRSAGFEMRRDDGLVASIGMDA